MQKDKERRLSQNLPLNFDIEFEDNTVFVKSINDKDFEVSDEEMAYIIPAKIQALTAIDLLYDNAQEAKKIILDFKPKFTKKEYLDLLDSFFYKTLWQE